LLGSGIWPGKSSAGLDIRAVELIHALPDDTNELGVAFLVEPLNHISFGRF
jgi:hypothetical protein